MSHSTILPLLYSEHEISLAVSHAADYDVEGRDNPEAPDKG
jgi:hypothetical protein